MEPGQTIVHGKYQLQRLIGEGGMARVWLAEELTFGHRRVAIKEPRTVPQSALAHEIEERYRREVQVCAALEQAGVPNIVRALTAEPSEGGLLLVMEYMPGGDLAALLREHPGGLPVEQAVSIALDLLRALQGVHAHELEIVHRDIKPSNVLFDGEGRAYLADFGLAQLAGMSGRSQLAGGQHPGTPIYMAPEQETSTRTLTPAADVFALGCVLFEMLTGQRYKRHQPGTPVSALRPELPPWLDEIVSKAVQEDPWRRWRDAGEMAASIGEAEERAKAQAVEEARLREAEEQARARAAEEARRREAAPSRAEPRTAPGKSVPGWVPLLGGVLAVVIVAMALVLLLGEWPDPEETPTPEPTRVVAVEPTAMATPLGGGSGRIAFEFLRDDQTEIYVMNADGSGQANLTNHSARDFDPSWSPDGTRIAFASYRDGHTSEIYVMNADGSGQTRLTTNYDSDYAPAWSPDGTRIAFTSVRSEGLAGIYVMNADGTGQICLTDRWIHDTSPTWSPDGKHIAVRSIGDGFSEIYVMNADGSGRTRLTDNPARDEDPAWSPDGKRIAFVSYRDDNPEIYVMNADGSGQTRLTDNPAKDEDPTWSPDGQRIAFFSVRDRNTEIYVMDADGSGQTRLTNSFAREDSAAWSPDGKHIAFESVDELYIMNADGSGLTRLTDNSASAKSPAWSP